MNGRGGRRWPLIAALGGAAVVLILVLGTLWIGRAAGSDTERAVRSVSLLYLDELAGRREQVVADNLSDNINVINIAIGLLTDEDLSDMAHLQAYQARMKLLFRLDKFAFVNERGSYTPRWACRRTSRTTTSTLTPSPSRRSPSRTWRARRRRWSSPRRWTASPSRTARWWPASWRST